MAPPLVLAQTTQSNQQNPNDGENSNNRIIKTSLPSSDSSENSNNSDGFDDSSGSGEVPNPEPNPLNSSGDSIDKLIQMRINDDLWQQMRGELPCAEATTGCIAQLQALASQKNPLLREIDARIEEIQNKINEAQAANKKSISLAVLRPAVRVFIEPTFDQATTQGQRKPGTVEKLLQIFTSPVGVVNEVLKAIGIPLFDSLFGGSDQNQQRAIAISDLQVKLAEIQRGRAQLNDQIKEKVALAVFDFDTTKREFQISQEIASREATRLQLTQVEYRLGQGDTNNYLASITSLDRQKAQTFRSWSGMRSQLEKIKLLVLGTEN
jgi:hypothetical protein